MSEGRIEISGLDIRQTTIKTPHLVDESVTTPKIADVAVTIEKTDEPVWTYFFEAPIKVDSALTATYAEIVTETVDIPSWVGLITVLGIGWLQVTNGSGGVQSYLISTRLNDVESGSVQFSVPDGSIGANYHIEGFQLSTPGSSIELSAYARTGSGTNNANKVALKGLLVGVR